MLKFKEYRVVKQVLSITVLGLGEGGGTVAGGMILEYEASDVG